jgi:hypothetical protein
LKITHAKSIADFEGILKLQRENLTDTISVEEKNTQGFVMVQHRLKDLEEFSHKAPQLIAKDGDDVCGYVLAMPKEFRQSIPMLVPMFEQLDQILVNGISIAKYDYVVVGQICIKKGNRGFQLFDQLYEAYKQLFQPIFDFAITEISTSNIRSMRAHERVGFKAIHTFRDQYEEWNIVCWDWKSTLE